MLTSSKALTLITGFACFLLLLSLAPSTSTCVEVNEEGQCADQAAADADESLEDDLGLLQTSAVSVPRPKAEGKMVVEVGKTGELLEDDLELFQQSVVKEGKAVHPVGMEAAAEAATESAQKVVLPQAASTQEIHFAGEPINTIQLNTKTEEADVVSVSASTVDNDEERTAAKLALAKLANSSWRVGPPVSTAMKCIVALLLQYFTVYGLLVMRRTIAQYYGTHKNVEEELLESTATLTVNSLSTLAVLFLAVEMLAGELARITETVTGLPPWWAEVAMVFATMSSIVVSFFFLLQEACAGSKGKFFKFLHFGATVVQYVSVAVVIIATLAMDVPYVMWLGSPTNGISPAVRCVITLTVMHFAAVLFLKVCKACDRSPASRLNGSRLTRLIRAAELAAGTQNLVPMLGLLILATRLQTSPGAESVSWYQCQIFFYICTYALLAKALSCLPIILWGDYDRERSAMVSEYAHSIVKGLAELVVYVGVAAITLWIYQQHGGNLAPVVKALLVLSTLFFAICLFFHISQTSDALSRRSDAHSDLLSSNGAIPLLKAAMETIMFCPMLCVLICAMHFRALELSNYQGQPQQWVQSCMYFCMASAIMQLSMVLITGVIAGEPAESMPKSIYSTFTADQQKQTNSSGWTLVAIIGQYISMACLFGSTAAMICGIFTATPANTLI